MSAPRSPETTTEVGPRPPADLTASTLGDDTEEIAVFSFPIPPRGPRLTAAEVRVLMGLLGGKSNHRIARERGVALRTIANQVSSIYRKLGVSSRFELVARWALLAESV